jgi:signal transduction histidine kinase
VRPGLLVLLLFIPGFAFAQQDQIDTLEKKLHQVTDTGKSKILVQLAELYYNSDIKKSLKLGQEALTISQQLNDEAGVYQAQKILRRVHRRLGNFNMAVEYTLSSLPLLEKQKDSIELLDTYMTLGNIYSAMQNFNEAHVALQKAVQLARALNAPVLANTLNYLGRNYGKMKKYDSALVFIKEALQHEVDNPQPGYGLSYIYNNLAEVYLELNRYDEATYYYTLALTLSEERQSPFGKTFSYNGLARVYQQTHQYEKAISSALKSIEIAKENLYRDKAREAYGILYEIYEARNDYKQALAYYRQFNLYKDSIFSEDRIQYIENLKINYESERMEQENALLRKDTELKNARLKQQYILGWVAVAAVLFLLAGSFLLYRINIHRKRNNVLLAEYNKSLENQVAHRTKELATSNIELGRQNSQLEQFSYIIAHNFRSTVARISGLVNIISTYNLPDKEVTGKLAEAARELETTLNDLIKIIELKDGATDSFELVNLQERLDKVCLVLRERIKEAKPTLKVSFLAPVCHAIPAYLESILYNLLSNALKYRIKYKPLVITVESQIENGKFLLTFSDNGLGFDYKNLKDKIFNLYQRFHNDTDGKGMGLFLVKTQVEAMGGTIEVNSVVNEGTTFKIALPATP